MKLELKTSKVLPCEPIIFKINNISADMSDFGYLTADREDEYGCLLKKFIPYAPKKHILQYYGISKDEFYSVVYSLQNTFRIEYCRNCSWKGSEDYDPEEVSDLFGRAIN